MRLESKMKPRLRAQSICVISGFEERKREGLDIRWRMSKSTNVIFFLLFLIFANIRPERTIVTYTETDAKKQAHAIRRNLADLPNNVGKSRKCLLY